MAKQTINIGASPNDGTGTPLRTAFDYTNQNFTELYTATGPSGNNIVVPGNATITGDLTVDTSTLKVDSTNNRVGILTASPRSPFALDVLGNVALGDSTTTSSVRLKLDCAGTAGNVAIMSFAAAGTNKVFYGLSGGFLGDASTDAIIATDAAGAAIRFYVSDTGSEAMRLNSTGLGVGGAPISGFRLNVNNGDFRVSDAQNEDGVEIGWSPSAGGLGFVQAYNRTTSAFKDLVLNAAVTINTAGNVGIGVTPASGKKLDVKSDGTTNTTFAAQFRDSADAVLFSVRSDGYFNTGSSPLSPYNNITGSAANMFVDSSGFAYRSTSSLKYKTDVKDSIHGLADVLKLRSVTYKSKNGDDTVFGGLIAEEVHAAGLTEFVAYAPDKTPDSINYGNMVALLVSAIKELTARVQTLEAK